MIRTFLASRLSGSAALLGMSLLIPLGACTGASDVPPVARELRPLESRFVDVTPSPTVSVGPDLDVLTGPAILVESGYIPPGDHVASTGAYVPVNGKPTLVFVDSIW